MTQDNPRDLLTQARTAAANLLSLVEFHKRIFGYEKQHYIIDWETVPEWQALQESVEAIDAWEERQSPDNDAPELKTCRECFCGYLPKPKDDGFCSDSCAAQWEAEMYAGLAEEDANAEWGDWK